jgi:hypothetical protein
MAIEQRQTTLAKLGLRLGINLGFWLAVIYAAVVSILFMFTYSKPNPTLLGVLGGIIFLCAVGVFPSIIIGGFTGWLIGKTLEQFVQRLSRRIAFLLGLLICAGIALLMNIVFLGLQYIIFIPSIIYVGAGGYATVRLYRENLKASALQQP